MGEIASGTKLRTSSVLGEAGGADLQAYWDTLGPHPFGTGFGTKMRTGWRNQLTQNKR